MITLRSNPQGGATLWQILRLAAPAILNNVAAPICAALKLGLLGHYSGSSPLEATWAVAAYTGVSAVVDFASSMCNFVVVVSMARVGHARGANDTEALATAITSAIATSVTAGFLFAGLLWLARDITLDVTSLSANEVKRASRVYPICIYPRVYVCIYVYTY